MTYYKATIILVILVTVLLAIYRHSTKEFTEANYLVGWATILMVALAMTPN